MSNDVIRVLIADDHAVVRTGLRAVLGTARDIAVVGEAQTGREAVMLAQRLRPAVVVMDLSMPEMDGTAAIAEIVGSGTPSRVLVLTMHGEEDYLVPTMAAGATGYLVKSAADRELIDAVRAVARGDSYVRPAGARVLAERLTRPDPAQPERAGFAKLTRREQDVLRLVAHGYSAPEIGERLEISAKTVDTYKQRIHDKVGLARRAEYVRFALKLGLLTPT